MEDEDTGQSAKQKKSDDGSDSQNNDDKAIMAHQMMMSLIQHLLPWKQKLNLKFYKLYII